jgi:hypothetical protein
MALEIYELRHFCSSPQDGHVTIFKLGNARIPMTRDKALPGIRKDGQRAQNGFRY